ncbi:MAG: AcvB/VirJ family lysyl-phosphatidylglycerol hydrolase [Acidobacteriota bacterium]
MLSARRRYGDALRAGALLAAALLAQAACATLATTGTPSAAARAAVFVQGRWLSLRVSLPTPLEPTRPLVLYITGDGGWRGKDLDTFEHLCTWGYAVAGISAPDYLGRLNQGVDQIPPQELADDIAAMVGVARTSLHVPDAAPVVLLGVSRGADLAVVAAARASLGGAIRGVLAVGLTAEEEFVRPQRRRRASAVAAGRSDDDVAMARPYVSLRRVAVPVSLIQSTHDEYVPADEARRLFGPDTAVRQLRAIESRNHSFSDARDDLYEAMKQSLQWVEARGASQVAP